MQQDSNRNNLGYLGEDFQFKLIHTLLDEHEFFQELCPILNQNMFTDPNLRVIVGVMKDYYEKESNVPSYQMMGILLRDKAYTEIDSEFYLATLQKIEATPSDGVDYIRELATKFFRQQNMVRVANEIIKIAKDGDLTKYDACVELIDQASIMGTHDDFGVSVLDNLNNVLSPSHRIPIPTGVEALDKLLEGGIGKGEVGLIIGPSGFGKTSMTTSFATEAAIYACEANNYHGFRVLQVVTEDKEIQIQRKHIAKITQIEQKDLDKQEYLSIVHERLQAFPPKEAWKENLRIKRVRTGETSVNDIKRLVKKMINRGFKPDLLIIDYFESLNHDVHKGVTNDYLKEAKSMRQIEAMADELDIAIWLPSQGTKDSADCELVTMSKAGGAVQKTQVAHIILSISRTEEDKVNNRATLALLKNRSGGSGDVMENCYFNNGTSTIRKNVDDMGGIVSFAQYNHKRTEEEQNAIAYTQAQLINEMQKKKK